MKIIDQILEWYQGEESSHTPGSLIFSGVRYKRHWTSEAIHQLVKFWLINWRILLPIIIAAFVALFIHFDSKSTGESKQKNNKQGSVNSHSVPLVHSPTSQ